MKELIRKSCFPFRRAAVSILLAAVLSIYMCLPSAGADPAVFEKRGVKYFNTIIELLREENVRQTPNLRSRIENVIEEIRKYRSSDYEIALSIMDCWDNIAMNKEYPILIWQGGESADELADSGIVNSSAHAFIVMGYELAGGKMRDELKLRCDAAAAAARTYPDAWFIGTGGVTGPNNRQHRSEGQAIADYLTKQCGIDPSRVLVEGDSANTAGNAVNVFRLLKLHDIHTITIITSAYHQVWCQLLFYPMAEVYRQYEDYDVRIVANYNVIGQADMKPEYGRKSGLSQLSQIFGKYNDSKKRYGSD